VDHVTGEGSPRPPHSAEHAAEGEPEVSRRGARLQHSHSKDHLTEEPVVEPEDLQDANFPQEAEQKDHSPQASISCQSEPDKLPPGLAEILDSIDDADLMGLADNYKQAWRWDSLTPMFEPRKLDANASSLEEVASARRSQQGSPRLSLLSGDSPLFCNNNRNASEHRRVHSALGSYFRHDWGVKQKMGEMSDDTRLKSGQHPKSFFDTAVRNSACITWPEMEIGELSIESVQRPSTTSPGPFGFKPILHGAPHHETKSSDTPQSTPRVAPTSARRASGALRKARAQPQTVTELPMMGITTVKPTGSTSIKGEKAPVMAHRRRQSVEEVSHHSFEDVATRTPSPEDTPLPALSSRGATATVSPPWLTTTDPSPSPDVADCAELLRPGTAPGLPVAAGRQSTEPRPESSADVPRGRLGAWHHSSGPRPESSIDVRREFAADGSQLAGARPESSMDVRREHRFGAQAAAGSRSGAQTSMGSRPGEQAGAHRWHAGAVSWRQGTTSKAKPPSPARQTLRLGALLRR